jgi:outer membrane protein assembly factor BamD (BamD/ComL family)
VQPSEKVLVFDAMHALRREGHPEQAAKLLGEYLRRYPQGSLAEEALALSIEAFTSLGDPKAKNLADRYLVLYPNGRFRAAAERARARFAP